MKGLFTNKNYSIESRPITLGVLYAFFILMVAQLVLELTIDLKTTSSQVLLPIVVFPGILILLGYRHSQSRIFKELVVLGLFAAAESNFIFNPNSFHTIIYWLPVIPTVALILSGLRSAVLWTILIALTHLVNGHIVFVHSGDYYPINVWRIPYLFGAFVFAATYLSASFLLYILLGDAYQKMRGKNEELQKLKDQTAAQKNKLERYQQSIISFNRSSGNYNKGKIHFFESISQNIQSTIGVDQVFIWMFDSKREKLRCDFHSGGRSNSSIEFAVDKILLPVDFDKIKVNDAEMRQLIHDHTDSISLKNSSLILPVLLDQQCLGLLHLESLEQNHIWPAEDILYMQSMSEFIAIYFKNVQIKDLINEVRLKNKELKKANENLETLVAQRTVVLENQNQQLREYAFINSHLVRAPVAKIMGFGELLQQDAENNEINQHIVSQMIDASREMDELIKKINQVIDDGGEVSRNSISRSNYNENPD